MLQQLDRVAEPFALRIVGGVEGELLVAAAALLDPLDEFGGEHLRARLFEHGERQREVHVAPTRQRSTVRQPGAAVRRDRRRPAQQPGSTATDVEAVAELLGELGAQDLLPPSHESETFGVGHGHQWGVEHDARRSLELVELVRSQVDGEAGAHDGSPTNVVATEVAASAASIVSSQHDKRTVPIGARNSVS